MMGYCAAGNHHKEDGTGCPGHYLPFYIDVRRGKSVIVYRDEEVKCDCPCHGKTQTKTPRKKVKRK